jgi:general secretion pathway protein G
MVVVAIIGILAAIAYPPFVGFLTTVRYQKGKQDLKNIESEIMAFMESRGHLPDSLAEVGMSGMLDPWGNPYTYLRIDGGTTPGLNGKRRRDRNLNPVNTDFDLYSNGPDGKSAPQFMAAKARDDLVRANNGRYFGVAEEHAPL